MFVLLLRHAEATPASESGRDEDRELTPRGLHQAEAIAAWLASPASDGWRPTAVYVSAAERARRTGAIVAEHLGVPLQEIAELHPDNTPQGLITLTSRAMERRRPALLVGHNPNLHTLLDLVAPGTAPLDTGELVVVGEGGRIVARIRGGDGA